MSPRDEEELVNYLRTLDGSDHLQTYTIPQLASSAADPDQENGGGGLFGRFRRKKESAPPIAGCDPDLFATQVRHFIERSAELKTETVAALQQRVAELEFKVAPFEDQTDFRNRTGSGAGPTEAAETDAAGGGSSSWSSPFEWRRNTPAPTPSNRPEEPQLVVAEARAALPEAEIVEPETPLQPLVTRVPLAVEAESQETQAQAELQAELRRVQAEAEARADQ